MMRSMNVVAFAMIFFVIFFLGSINVGLAQDNCIKCQQSSQYICMQNFGECTAACRSVGAIDKDACRRKCHASDDGCKSRADLTCGKCKPKNFAVPPPARMH